MQEVTICLNYDNIKLTLDNINSPKHHHRSLEILVPMKQNHNLIVLSLSTPHLEGQLESGALILACD